MMEQSQTEVQEQVVNPSAGKNDPPATVAPFGDSAARAISPQACPTCGTVPAVNGGTTPSPSWVYAIGNIEARFPTVSLGKEFAQATGRDKTSWTTDRQALPTERSKPQNPYCGPQACFGF